MPLEIRELHIKAVVNEGGQGASSNSSSASAGQDKEAIIRACVEKVMEILKEKQER